jgi:hypothetical protein
MPVTSRAFVKTSVIYLCVGAVLGALMLVDRWLPIDSRVITLRASHIELLVVGWLTQLILGVAWWLFPPLKRARGGDTAQPVRRGQAQRGSEPLFWATFMCLNLGVLLVAVLEPLAAWTQIGELRSVASVADLFFLAAAVAFVANMWQRVRALKD